MDDDGEVRAKVEKYMRMLDSEGKMGHALKRLASINMTLDLLSETGVGKAVNQLRNHEHHGGEALRIVNRWKAIARSHGLKQRKSRSSSSSLERMSSSPERMSPSPEHKASPPKKSKKDKQHREKVSDEDVEKKKKGKTLKSKASSKSSGASGSGISFEEMLARGDVVRPAKAKKPKLELGDWNSSQVDVNYRPSRRLSFEPTPVVKEHHAGMSEAAAMDVSMFKPRKDKRKIYAGRPKGDIEVPSLATLCIRVLCSNIDAIEEVGDTPYYLLKPVLERCSPEQLCFIERRNPHLMEDSDELWEKVVNRTFPKCQTGDDETWRDCYTRMCAETDRKLKMLSSRITQHNRETAAPVRKALLADAKAPRDVRKKQIKYGTAHINHALPDASQISQARRAIFEKGSKEALSNLPRSVRNADSTLGSHSDKKKPAKKGALMVKTLKMLKGRNRK
ncbi:Transcription elongation factor B polypeptide 3 [Toxocara canis]|uniref:Transcription elongation factor B polypeptide 3 n=1 Tax=Toxocara canis TaxID=6265 RepID=A0A0B2VF01_TOXCA|nr:Transcription elongation factor B polypeptide 3 [Toxocara canis]